MKPLYHVYILTNSTHSTLYVGVTNNLSRRLFEHKESTNRKAFSTKYNTNKLVAVFDFENIQDAISFEKKLKGGSRAKKEWFIELQNPYWEDLGDGF